MSKLQIPSAKVLSDDTIPSSNPHSQTEVMQSHFQAQDLVRLTASFNYPDVPLVSRFASKGTSVERNSPKFKGIEG